MSLDQQSETHLHAGSASSGRPLQKLPDDVRSIQPGGGFCMACELFWGKWRRRYLRTFRQRYLERMRRSRCGGDGDYPHEILDPRDLKYFCNQGDLHWKEADDPFRWRERLPVARVGLAEIVILSGSLLLVAAVLSWFYWPLGLIPLALALFLIAFFRDPRRQIPQQPGQMVAPADGRIFSIRQVDDDAFLGGPAVVVDIFLSVFNVHINRVPADCRVLGVVYRPGKFLNALRPQAARENEAVELRLEESAAPFRPLRIRQITGAIARRIVCWARPGDHLPRGGQFGMIKLGSRTELSLPQEPGLEICVSQGQKVRAGSTVIARYRAVGATSPAETGTSAGL